MATATMKKTPPIGAGRDGKLDKLRRDLSSLKEPDDCVVFPYRHLNHYPYLAAEQLGIRITCRKRRNGGWDIWRVFGV